MGESSECFSIIEVVGSNPAIPTFRMTFEFKKPLNL